jgi:hypothetical protein
MRRPDRRIARVFLLSSADRFRIQAQVLKVLRQNLLICRSLAQLIQSPVDSCTAIAWRVPAPPWGIRPLAPTNCDANVSRVHAAIRRD